MSIGAGGSIPLGTMTMDVGGIMNAAKQVDSQIVKLAKSIERSMEGGAASTKKLTTALGHIGGAMLNATKDFSRGSSQMSTEIGKLRVELGKHQGAMAAFTKQVNDGFKQVNDSISKLADTVSDLASQVRTGLYNVAQAQKQEAEQTRASATAWQRFGETGRRAAEGLSRALEPLRGKAREAGMAVGALTAATVGLTAAGLKIGSSYEQSMARVKAVTRSTDEEMKALSAEAQRLGVVTVHSARDAAEGMAMLAQGGYNAAKIIKAMPAVFQLVDVAQTDTASASRVLINVMESMQVPVEELEGTVDMLARALTLGGNNLEEFAEAFKYVGPSAKALNIPLNEVAATIQILGKNGIQASMAGTTLRQTFIALATMPKKMKDDFKNLGIDIYDQFGRIKTSLPQLLDELQRGFARSERKGGAVGNIMQDFNARAGGGLTALLNAIAADRGVIEKAAAEVGAAVGQHYSQGVAEGMRDTLQSRGRMVLGTLQGFGITLVDHMGKTTREGLNRLNDWIAGNKQTIDGYIRSAWDTFAGFTTGAVQSGQRLYQAWAPTLDSLWQKTKQLYGGFMQWFDSLPPGIQDAMKVGAALTGVSLAMGKIGGLIPILGPLLTGIAGLINPVSGLAAAFRMVVGIVSGAGGLLPLFGLLFSPAGLVLAGVAALTALVGYLNGDVKGAFVGLAQILDTALLGTLTRIADLFKEVKGAIDDVMARAKVNGESQKRTNAFRDSVRQRYGADALTDYDAYEAANKAVIERRRQANEARDYYAANKSYRNFGDVALIQNADADIAALVEAAEAARIKWEQRQAAGEAAIKNEQQVKQEQAWRDQQVAQDQQALAPQLAQGEVAQQRARQQQGGPGAGTSDFGKLSFFDRQSLNYHLNSMTAGQAADYFKSAPKAVADALKPDKEGNVDAAKAKNVAATYIDGLRQMKGLNQQAVNDLESRLEQAIKQIAKSPPALRDMLIAQLNEVDVKLHQIFDPNGVYAKDFAHSIGQQLKKEIGDAVHQIVEQADAAATTLGIRVNAKLGNRGGAFQRGAEGLAEAGSARIKAHRDRVKAAEETAMNPALTPQARAAAQEQLRLHQNELNRVVAEEQQKAANADALAPGQFNRNAINSETVAGKAALVSVRNEQKNQVGSVNALTKGQQQQQVSQIQQQFQQYLAMLRMAAQLDGQAKETQLAEAAKARAAFDDMVNAAKRGQKGLDDFKAAAGRAANQAKALADAEEKLTDDEIAKMNARGIFTQKQQQQMAAQMQQVQGWMQQNIFGPMQQAQAVAQGAANQPIIAGGQVQDLIDQAKQAGNPQQAIDIARSYIQAQIQQTLFNVANAAGMDPIRASFGTLSQPGILPVNFQQRLNENPQAAATVAMFQKMLDALAHAPKMATGGIVTDPTLAMIGEAGPEAVIPLNQYRIPVPTLQALFGNPANIFPNAGQFRLNPGGMQFDPFGLTAGRLGLFDQRFNLAGGILNQQMDLGNLGAGGILAQWGQAQQALEDSLTYTQGRRSIDMGGNAGWANGVGAGHTMHFNFGDIHLANGTDEQVASLAQRISDAVRSQGRDMTGRSGLGYSSNGRSSPLAPAGYPR